MIRSCPDCATVEKLVLGQGKAPWVVNEKLGVRTGLLLLGATQV